MRVLLAALLVLSLAVAFALREGERDESAAARPHAPRAEKPTAGRSATADLRGAPLAIHDPAPDETSVEADGERSEAPAPARDEHNSEEEATTVLESLTKQALETATRDALSRIVGGEPADGPFTSRHANGELAEQGAYHHGRRVGIWTTWYQNTVRESEGLCVQGEKHGAWTTWHPNGVVASAGEYLYGKREGAWVEYHDDGARAETATYVNGKRHGKLVSWWDAEHLRWECEYDWGEMHGPYREYHLNGRVAGEGRHERGSRTGRWKFWDEEGVLDRETSGLFEEGARVAD